MSRRQRGVRAAWLACVVALAASGSVALPVQAGADDPVPSPASNANGASTVPVGTTTVPADSTPATTADGATTSNAGGTMSTLASTTAARTTSTTAPTTTSTPAVPDGMTPAQAAQRTTIAPVVPPCTGGTDAAQCSQLRRIRSATTTPASPVPTPGPKSAGRSGSPLHAAPTPSPPPVASEFIPALPAQFAALSDAAMNSLVGSFPVPPFLLPIYQAAGIEYGVPWQVLAAINEVETDFGRNLATSSAGAAGWMQFMPATWQRYGLDADQRGRANPYDPIDAIFAAARYLRAAGAERNIGLAIFAYNHASWYVNSVELRAKLIELLPADLVSGLSSLMLARYPVAGHLGADATVPPRLVTESGAPAVVLAAPARAPVIAVADSRVVGIGRDRERGRYVVIEDSFGNRFTYSQLGVIASLYPVVRPRVVSALDLARGLPRTDTRVRTITAPAPLPVVPLLKERLFAFPSRPASYAAGGRVQLASTLREYVAQTGIVVGTHSPDDYFSVPIRLRVSDRFALAPLRVGATVLAGTIIGRAASPTRGGSGGVELQIRPRGSNRAVDPAGVVSGWRVLGRLTAGRVVAGAVGQSGAYGSTNATLGQLLLFGPGPLAQAVLSDPNVRLDACSRAGIAAGGADWRALAAIEYLAYSALKPVVSGISCAARRAATFRIVGLGDQPVAGHQRPGELPDLAIRLMLALRGAVAPSQIVSLHSYPWGVTTLALPDHADAIEVDFAAPPRARPGLETAQWQRLFRHLGGSGDGH